jgi:hypothetical protein
MITVVHRLKHHTASKQSRIRYREGGIIFQLRSCSRESLYNVQANQFFSIQVIILKYIKYIYSNTFCQHPPLLHYILGPTLPIMFHLLKVITKGCINSKGSY